MPARQTLSQFTLLNTRPNPMGEQLQSLCQEHGLSSIQTPMIDTQPLPVSLPDSFDRDCEDTAIGWIFVSRTAVRLFAHALTKANRSFYPKGAIIAVGPGSRTELMRHFNLPESMVICPSESNSESLITLTQLTDGTLRKVWLLKGEAGRTVIQQHLNKHKIQLEELNLYRRATVQYSDTSMTSWFQTDLILATSTDIADAILTNAKSVPKLHQALLSKPWLVLSDRIKHYLAEKGVDTDTIFICEQTDNSSIISNIKRMAK